MINTPPTIGRIVHYRSYGTPGGEYTGECRAATVTEVGENGRVGLAVLNPTGLFFRPISEGGADHLEPRPDDEVSENAPKWQGGTWHWPCV